VSAFDLRSKIVGEWEILNLSNERISLCTVEFHVDKQKAIIGSLSAPNASDGEGRFLSAIFEVVFSSQSSGDIIRLTPERAFFTHFAFASPVKDPSRAISRSKFSATESYQVIFMNGTYGHLSVTDMDEMSFRRNPDTKPKRTDYAWLWRLMTVGLAAILSECITRWCRKISGVTEFKAKHNKMMDQLSKVHVVDGTDTEKQDEEEEEKKEEQTSSTETEDLCE
jgi:hypothetical protein